jgi:hypothetical protein
METYLAGPLFLVSSSNALPSSALTVSACLAVIAPDTWAIEWVSTSEADRIEAAARCGIPESRLSEVIDWATDKFDHGFAWPNAFLDIATAQEFRRQFLGQGFRLLQIGLAERLAPSFLELAAPPPQQVGYSPMGSTAAHECLGMKRRLTEGEPRGFEVLGYERYGGGFESFRCFGGLPEDFVRLGATFSSWGLIDDEACALRCAGLAGETGSCADVWHAWAIVEHPC